jgi:acyl-CoA synthetase (NDP forming)
MGNICQNRAAFTDSLKSMAHWLQRLLNPQTIAIVGASERAASLAAITHRQLVERGYRGNIYPVNPKYPSVRGATCYACLSDLPELPDLVIYAISGLALERSFDEAMTLGIGGVVIYAANYLEQDTEPRLVERLRRKAAAAGIPVCGGNSMGFYNYDDGVMVSFDHPPAERPGGHIGLIVHSGSAMTYLANNDARFCFNYVIASGQEINASAADYMDYLVEQESTRVIALFQETVRDAPAFVAALQKARDKSIPVVIMRLGRTEKSAQLAQSHSGAIVGDYEAFVAVCERHGAILCQDADEMIVTAMLFGAGLRSRGGGLSSMLDSGGMREQMIDLAEQYGLDFAQISTATTGVLSAHLEAGLDAVNPMDGMGALGHESARTFLECGKALLDDRATGLLSFEFEFRDGFSHYPELLDVARQLAGYSDKPVVLVNSFSFATIAETAAELTWQGVPVINGIDVAMRALRNLMRYRNDETPSRFPPESDFDLSVIASWKQRLTARESFDEFTSLSLMADFGLPVVDSRIAENFEQVYAAAKSIGFPLVLKTAMPGIAHKSDQDGVRVDIVDRQQLEQAYLDLRQRLGDRVLLMPMVNPGVEVALGMKRDSQFGPMVIVACGGLLIELLAERAFRLAPVNLDQANAMLDQTRLAKLLAGVRGQAAVDRIALAELLVRFSRLAYVFADSIAEIDLNPVIVNQAGCTIVDALVVARVK